VRTGTGLALNIRKTPYRSPFDQRGIFFAHSRWKSPTLGDDISPMKPLCYRQSSGVVVRLVEPPDQAHSFWRKREWNLW